MVLSCFVCVLGMFDLVCPCRCVGGYVFYDVEVIAFKGDFTGLTSSVLHKPLAQRTRVSIKGLVSRAYGAERLGTSDINKWPAFCQQKGINTEISRHRFLQVVGRSEGSLVRCAATVKVPSYGVQPQ